MGALMADTRTICWTPIWNKEREGLGLEHLLLTAGMADSVVLGFDRRRTGQAQEAVPCPQPIKIARSVY
jgi:hypothetical protein